ncbi:MAG TPA: MFS transporter [Candidatus Saccharimonadales bacterium]|jgi:EmrB/QacA subfamily drug resistance transporter|nr:MFS transporter [Candidatus Saccharimonadales bacterium]
MTKQQRLVLTVAILGSFVAFLDSAIVNVALPAIQRDLGGGLAAQQWIVDAYLLTLGSLILIAGSLSDLLGRKRILTLGLLGFGVASLLCAVAPNSTSLIIFRALQGIAGALLVPSSLAMIISAFSGPAQGKAIGSWTAWTGISFILGPLVGGILVDSASWRWIFAINLLPIAVTLFLMRNIEVVKDEGHKTPVDYFGSLLCAVGLAGPVFALIEQPHYGWGSPLIYLPLVLGFALLAGFLMYERRAEHPMLPLSLFKNHNFSVGNIATLSIYAGLSASTFILIVFLQQVAGYSALAAGFAGVPITLIMFVLSPRMGALAGKYGPRLFMGIGPIIGAIGFALMLRVTADTNYWTQVFPGIVVFGIGLSITVAPLTAAILGDVPKNQAGIASAVNNAVARIAGLLAVAAVGAVIAAQFSHTVDQKMANSNVSSSSVNTAKQVSLETTPPAPYQHNQAFKNVLTNASVSAFHAGLITVVGLLGAGGVISLIGIRNPTK